MKPNTAWQDLHDRLLETQLLILGEMHGAAVNPRTIAQFVERLGMKVVFIEVDRKYASLFAHLAADTISETAIELRKKSSWLFEAGVLSMAHLRTYASLIKDGVRIIPFKIEDRKWNRAEIATAGEISRQIKKVKGPAILVVGRLHARNKPFTLVEDGKRMNYHPLGSLLRSSAISSQIRYGRGLIFNFRNMPVSDSSALKALGKKSRMLQTSRSKYFDFDYMIRETKPLIRSK